MSFCKNTFKYGLGLLIPIALVIALGSWLYNLFTKITLFVIPESWEFQWWFPIAVLFSIIIVIFVIGFIFKYLKPLRWLKSGFEKYLIKHTPVVNKVYEFGKEFSDGFIADVKDDGDLTVVEVMFAGEPTLGLLTDSKNDIVFVATAPSPLSGFIIKTSEYKRVDMSAIDYFKLLGSLGRINGSKWH